MKRRQFIQSVPVAIGGMSVTSYASTPMLSALTSALYDTDRVLVIVQLSGEFTRKLFSKRERGFGNKIIFESSNLAFASMQTKLNLVNFVDRGILNPNEVRAILNLAPIPGGEVYLRRLDTRPADE